jgi:hypothetical protein
MDRAKVIFGNEIREKDYQKAVKKQADFVRKYGDDRGVQYGVSVQDAPVITEYFGAQNLVSGTDMAPELGENALLVGNIRMGFGHYRIAMAIASAAASMGKKPYWLDLLSFPESDCSRIIAGQNELYSMGSRWSQKYPLFNKLVWEPMNSEGFRKLSYNAADQKTAELFAPILSIVEEADEAHDDGEQGREARIAHAAGEADGHREEDGADLLGRPRRGAEADERERARDGDAGAEAAAHHEDDDADHRGEQRQRHGEAPGGIGAVGEDEGENRAQHERRGHADEEARDGHGCGRGRIQAGKDGIKHRKHPCSLSRFAASTERPCRISRRKSAGWSCGSEDRSAKAASRCRP